MSTAFIALFLFGLALLIAPTVQPRDRGVDGQRAGGGVPERSRSGPTRCRASRRTCEQLPAVGSIEYWDKAATCDAFRRDCSRARRSSRRASTARRRSRPRCASTSPTRRSSTRSPPRSGARPTGATQEIQCTEPGVRDVSDYRELLDRLTAITRVLSIGVLSDRRDHACVGDRARREHLAHGHVRSTQGDRHHAARRRDELAHPSAVPDRGARRGRWSGRSRRSPRSS